MNQQSKKDRAAAARQRADELRRQAEAKARRTKAIIIAVTAVIVVALVGGVGVVVYGAWQKQVELSKGPEGLSERGGLIVGDENAKATVTLFTDFLCPACRQYEEQNGPALAQLKDDGKIKIEYVPISILDGYSNGTKYSTRASSAGFCVMESNPEVYEKFVTAMFASQPAENSDGLTNDEVAAIAAGAGVSAEGQTCIKEERFTGFAAKVTEKAGKEGVGGTPTVFVNDKPLDRDEGQSVFDALTEAGVDVKSATAG